jgi:septal ring factor EnvC (AmiA/AmiB activator)
MSKFRILFVVIAVLILAQPVMASVGTEKLEDQLKNYMNEITLKVKSTDDPEQKRAILNETLLKIMDAVETVEELPTITEKERLLISKFKRTIQDKYDELNGLNGFERVADEDLDVFTDYVMQDLEQARNYITMGLGLFILLIILIILIA